MWRIISKCPTITRPNVLARLAKNYATIASTRDGWDRWYATPTEPVVLVPPPTSAAVPFPEPQPVASIEPVSTAPIGTPSRFSGGGCSLPLSNHPSPRCNYHPAACADSRWSGGGGEEANTPLTRTREREYLPYLRQVVVHEAVYEGCRVCGVCTVGEAVGVI